MRKNDRFADIAAAGIATDKNELVLSNVRKTDIVILPFENADINTSVFSSVLSPEEELKQKIHELRAHYLPFLADLSPELKSKRERTDLNQFQWRISTPADKRDFSTVIRGEGNWENVKIPHFGGPLGNVETIYRTVFFVDELPDQNEGLFLHFNGVDYIAHVFLNGSLLGSHRGAFSAFEFDCTPCLHKGENNLVVCVKNDFIQNGSNTEESETLHTGEKLYASGPGYDDAEIGWHHAPPGMGIYQNVWFEKRNRQFIMDLFPRPMCDNAAIELHIGAYSTDADEIPVSFNINVYGKNFSEVVAENVKFVPVTGREIGLGDTFTEAQVLALGLKDKPVPLLLQKGQNDFVVSIPMGEFRWWHPDTPWLYEVQVELLNQHGSIVDVKAETFGMRTFTMDTDSEKKGMMYLNSKKIRLRGANTMGFEQLDIMRGDFDQLVEDILLAKACNMNFLRITQRPVQRELYDYCDRLGLLIQTDMPVTCAMPRSQLIEAVRQAQDMEHLVRSHPCVILCTYINEPAPNALNEPHRNLDRNMLEKFFDMADIVVHYENPDRVVKHIDGDYDPPSKLMPDYHCYTGWYNGHGVDIGALHKGDWLPVSPGWYYGCGEFGAEGIDYVSVMRKYYPHHWLPKTPTEEYSWSPNSIVGAQCGSFHYFFFETPNTLEEWVVRSQEHQAEVTKFMVEAFRRNDNMVSFAIHLFIDAWPAGWMKAIVDVDRNPKPAYYAYKDALTPTMVSLRTDRFTYFTAERACVELWICNDLPEKLEDTSVLYQIRHPDGSRKCGSITMNINDSCAIYGGELQFDLPFEGTVVVDCVLVSKDSRVLHRNSINLKVWPKAINTAALRLHTPGKTGPAQLLIQEMGAQSFEAKDAECILFDQYDLYESNRGMWDNLAREGKHLVFLDLPSGRYELCNHDVMVKESSMLGIHFVSRNTGHPWVYGFHRKDFRYWYDKESDRITPFLERTFTSNEMIPVLTSGNTDSDGEWKQALAVATASIGKGSVTLCQLQLVGRVKSNPVALNFAKRMLTN